MKKLPFREKEKQIRNTPLHHENLNFNQSFRKEASIDACE